MYVHMCEEDILSIKHENTTLHPTVGTFHFIIKKEGIFENSRK